MCSSRVIDCMHAGPLSIHQSTGIVPMKPPSHVCWADGLVEAVALAIVRHLRAATGCKQKQARLCGRGTQVSGQENVLGQHRSAPPPHASSGRDAQGFPARIDCGSQPSPVAAEVEEQHIPRLAGRHQLL